VKENGEEDVRLVGIFQQYGELLINYPKNTDNDSILSQDDKKKLTTSTSLYAEPKNDRG